VFEVRAEIAAVCQQKADKIGEPPLGEQGDIRRWQIAMLPRPLEADITASPWFVR
jgi:hypothetical protein